MQPFHLAFPVTSLAKARAFYGDLLGCSEGRSSEHWIDFNFYGHQIVAHLSPSEAGHHNTSAVDGDNVPVRHFGLVMEMGQWEAMAERLKKAGTSFVIEPHIRFKGQVGEQATMFFLDPCGNAVEFKAFANPESLFAKYTAAPVSGLQGLHHLGDAVVCFGGINPAHDADQLQHGIDPGDGRARTDGKPRSAGCVLEQCAIFVEPDQVAVVGRDVAGLLHHLQPLLGQNLLALELALTHEHQANQCLVHGRDGYAATPVTAPGHRHHALAVDLGPALLVTHPLKRV